MQIKIFSRIGQDYAALAAVRKKANEFLKKTEHVISVDLRVATSVQKEFKDGAQGIRDEVYTEYLIMVTYRE